jgi:purine-nucleoside phosphorylase
MSTVPEVQCAVHCGLKVLGMSLITNRVSVSKGRKALDHDKNINAMDQGDEGQLATHEEVLETSRERAGVFQELVCKIIESI